MASLPPCGKGNENCMEQNVNAYSAQTSLPKNRRGPKNNNVFTSMNMPKHRQETRER